MGAESGTARLVLGTMYYGTRVDRERAYALMDRFVEAGGVWLDTANCYSFWADPSGVGGASERVIGEWLRARSGVRGEVRIATKVRQDPRVPHRWPESAEGLSSDAVLAGVAGSVERLGIDSIDLLWAHAEDRSVPLTETVTAFGELVDRGVVSRVGAANHPAWRVEQARVLARSMGAEPWSALQLRHSLVQPRPGAALPDDGHRLLTGDDLDYADSEGLDVWAYTPLLNGGYVRADRPFPPVYDHPGTIRALRTLDDVAAETGATRNQVVLAWLLAQGIGPIIGVSDLAQLDEALDAAHVTLKDEHMSRFAAAR
ncbi:aldo/keto reductase [Microbacterium sp. SORGH_AS_0888]|uniref:aldo/keto reductase n=1 Tax=Microbacterium sp. SORGH_AS_0888 TaxID=3041791 RepID=UPI00278AE5BA|nr:aldo/keto reductase [Microbacterium sp. SORGH_AS_0888]MDQ1130563.1 aryl-alcohol dehydrogenase-like predicted oxidoreductase [Microbacterium sp. SORGH_AS_0888]